MATAAFMTVDVTGKTIKRPDGPYWYWTTLGPENVNLADRTVALPPGTYELHYDYRGNPGNKFAMKLTDTTGRVLVEVSESIPDGSLEGWGMKLFSVEPTT